ncbi:MAG: hypothetical protein AB7T49_00040 [Oligoflexales bacterium]
MKLSFEHNYQHKVMSIKFDEHTTLESPKDILIFRQRWLEALKTWHSPYKALVNLSNVEIRDTEANREEFRRMVTFLKGFFLKKAVAYPATEALKEVVPFDLFASEDEAATAVGLRKASSSKETLDFRSAITLANDFQRQLMELTFASEFEISAKEQVAMLRSKITNNLMQWHSAWNMLVDCSQITFDPVGNEEFSQLVLYFKRFFLKEIVGYSPKGKKETYPFPVYRARHNAVAKLVPEGTFSADEANCRSRK